MEFEGKIWQEEKFWLVEVPVLDVMTQGKSRKNALFMIVDAIKELLMGYFPEESIDSIELTVNDYRDGSIGITAKDSQLLFAISLRRQRAKSGSSVREVAERLGSKSPNSYAPYERGEKKFSFEQYEKLMHAANPSRGLRLRIT
jgi:predicted RNase H-like HicB family nuclease